MLVIGLYDLLHMGGDSLLLNAKEVFKFANTESSEESECAATLCHTMPRHLFVHVQAIMTSQIDDCCRLECDTASSIRGVAVFQMIVLPPVSLVLQDPDTA